MKAKEFIPASKPRNFVAKNQKTAGAGAHKDKKKAEKQGDVKHKKQYIPTEDISEISDTTKSSYKEKAKAQVKELEPWTKKGEYKDLAKRAIQRREKGLSRFKDEDIEEGWKSKVAGAALAGAAALGGGAAQASEPVGPMAVMATIKMQLPDGSVKTIKKDLGHSYDFRIDDAKKDLENLLDRKGIKKYSIHLDRYNSDEAGSSDQEKTKDYMSKTPATGKTDNKDYLDKSPYSGKPTKATYLDKSTGKEFRDMNNY